MLIQHGKFPDCKSRLLCNTDTLFKTHNNLLKNMAPAQTLNVLFVDDDTDESYLFNEAIEQSGYPFTLSRAHDGNQLLNNLRRRPLPDLVIMDINMPYKDGIEALEEIRSKQEFNKIIIIIYSISKQKAAIQRAYDKGADLYFIKPNDFEGMLAVVKKVYNIDWVNFKRPGLESFVLNLNK